MPFLGIDQSLNGTGLCLLSDIGGLLRLETVNPRKLRGVERLAFIKNTVWDIYKKFSVEVVAQESYAYNSQSLHHALGEIGGVLKLLAFEQQVPTALVAPLALKKFATGSSTASKEAMTAAAQAAVRSINVEDDNQADAFFLATIARHLGQNTNPRTRAALEVIHALRHPEQKLPKRRIRRLLKNSI